MKNLTSSIAEHQVHLAMVDHMLEYNEYRRLAKYIKEETSWKNQRVHDAMQLAQAYLDVNLSLIQELAPRLDRQYLLKPTYLERRVYSYAHYMNAQFQRKEYMDYFRALSPLMVDLLRILIEQDFMPELNEYIEPIIKDTDHGKPIYRGLQWQPVKVESSANKVRETFTRYYGNHFNYNHYISSSHLLKLIMDHGTNEVMQEKCNQLRHIEKYIRNIVSHEVIYVTDEFVQRRVNMSLEEIHQLLHEVIRMANLTDKRQWSVLDDLNREIKTIITDKII